MKFSKTSSTAKNSRKIFLICQVFSALVIALLLTMTKDFITNVASKNDTYEIKYEEETTLENGQMIYRLYKNGEFMGDVNYNKYHLLDNDGKTDFKYCALIDSASELSYAVILCVMILLVVLIIRSTAENTPFTMANVKRIRAISLLQLALAIVPGMVTFVMTLAKFGYVSGTFSFGEFYMFIIAFVITMIAQVFDYGVKLQEDSDSIV